VELAQTVDLEGSIAQAVTAGTGVLVGMHVDLCTLDLSYDRTTTLADLTPGIPTYTGYAAGTVVWETNTIADDGTVEVLGTMPDFRPTDAVAPNIVYGMFCRAEPSGALMLLGRFDNAPLPMGKTTDVIKIVLRYRPATASIAVVIS